MHQRATRLAAAIVAVTAILSTVVGAEPAAAVDRSAVFAHRGGDPTDPGKGGPDNSMAAFNAAIGDRFHVEADARLSSDGAAWLAHDDDLALLGCGTTGKVSTTHSRQLRALRCNGQPLATLAQLVQRLQQADAFGLKLLVETKAGSPAEADVVLLATMPIADRTIVESFWWASLSHVEAVAPAVATCALWNSASSTAAALTEPVDMLCPYYALATDAVLADGRPVVVWTVNDRTLADDLARRGVDGFISDKPDAIS